MATLKYPWWLSLWYRMGPVLGPIHRLRKRFSPAPTLSPFQVVLFHDIPQFRRPAFERFVDYLAENYTIVAPEDVTSLLADAPSISQQDHTPVLLTFDDGFESQAVAAREVLDTRGIRGVFFVCPAMMELPPDQQRQEIAERMFEDRVAAEDLPKDMRLMQWDSAKALIDAGHTIGSHTGRHGRLATLAPGDRDLEIAGSKDLLESRLGTKMNWFAYPFGDVDSIDGDSMDLIGQHYRFCCSGLAGFNSRMTHRLGIRRQNIDLDLPFAYQTFVMDGGMDRAYARAARRYESLLPASK